MSVTVLPEGNCQLARELDRSLLCCDFGKRRHKSEHLKAMAAGSFSAHVAKACMFLVRFVFCAKVGHSRSQCCLAKRAHVLLGRVHPRISHCLVAPSHRGEPGAGLLEVAASRDARELQGRMLGPHISEMMSRTLDIINCFCCFSLLMSQHEARQTTRHRLDNLEGVER